MFFLPISIFLGGNENEVKKLAAPIALAARPLAVPDSPVMSRKKKAPIGQSKLAGTPNQKQHAVQRRNKEARSKGMWQHITFL